MKPNQIAGYTIQSISIVESKFTRIDDLRKERFRNDVVLNVKSDISEGIAKCKLTVNCESKYVDGTVLANAEVTALGIFKQRIKKPNLEINDFARLNALAIMYPFIREFLANISLKAGMKSIMIPIVNFYAFAKNLKKEDEA